MMSFPGRWVFFLLCLGLADAAGLSTVASVRIVPVDNDDLPSADSFTPDWLSEPADLLDNEPSDALPRAAPTTLVRNAGAVQAIKPAPAQPAQPAQPDVKPAAAAKPAANLVGQAASRKRPEVVPHEAMPTVAVNHDFTFHSMQSYADDGSDVKEPTPQEIEDALRDDPEEEDEQIGGSWAAMRPDFSGRSAQLAAKAPAAVAKEPEKRAAPPAAAAQPAPVAHEEPAVAAAAVAATSADSSADGSAASSAADGKPLIVKGSVLPSPLKMVMKAPGARITGMLPKALPSAALQVMTQGRLVLVIYQMASKSGTVSVEQRMVLNFDPSNAPKVNYNSKTGKLILMVPGPETSASRFKHVGVKRA